MRKGQRITNIGRKGEKNTKSSGRINHSKEEWKVIVEGVKKRSAERMEANKPISEDRKESLAKAILVVEARYKAEAEAKKQKKSTGCKPRRKKKEIEVDYSQIPESLLKSLKVK